MNDEQQRARERREAVVAARAEERKRLIPSLEEIASGVERLGVAKGHEGIEAANDQLSAILGNAPAPTPTEVGTSVAKAWVQVLDAGRELHREVAAGELDVQAQVDGISLAISGLTAAFEGGR